MNFEGTRKHQRLKLKGLTSQKTDKDAKEAPHSPLLVLLRESDHLPTSEKDLKRK